MSTPYILDEADCEKLQQFSYGGPKADIDSPQVGILVAAGYIVQDRNTRLYTITEEGLKRLQEGCP